MRTINIVVKLEEPHVTTFERYLRDNMDVVSYSVLPNTEELYKNDVTYQKLVKAVKNAKKIARDYYEDKRD